MANNKRGAQSGKKGGSIINAPIDTPNQQAKKAKKAKKQSKGK